MVSLNSSDMYERLALRVSAGRTSYETLRHSRNDVLTARAAVDSGESVIVKLWNRPTLKGALRRFTRTNAGYREWRALRTLHRAGVRVPQPLAYMRLLDPDSAHTEALASEDLGRGGRVIDRIQSLIAAGDLAGLHDLEDELVSITGDIIGAGVIDPDHRLVNFIVARDGRPARVDFEHAVSIRTPWGVIRHGVMLGTLIGSYVFAVQPHVHLAQNFAHRLAERLNPPRRVLRRAAAVSDAMLAHQRETAGIDARLTLGWTGR